MKRYFVASDNRIEGECLVENPVNPFGHQIVELEELAGNAAEYVYANGVALFSPPVLPMDQQIKVFIVAMQKVLDDGAKEKGYDNIVSACSYAGYPNIFQAEALSFGNWRSAVWAYGYAELAKVQAGTRPVPTVAEILAELPVRVLP